VHGRERAQGHGRWEKGGEKGCGLLSLNHTQEEKKWGKRKVEKGGGVERGDVVFGILKPNFKVDMRIGG